MKNNRNVAFIVYGIGLVVLACLFLFIFNISSVFAQENDPTATTTVVSEEAGQTEEKFPADVALDEKITTEDLGAVEASVLPGSALHIFKRFGWTVQEILETDPVADTELKIKHANQELSELKQLIEERGFSDVNPSVINAAMSRFEGRLDNVNNVAEALKDLRESDPETVDALLNNLTDKQFKYQKVLESIERDVIKEKEENENANRDIEDVFVKISETKDKALEHYGKVIEKVEDGNAEKIAERIIKVADKQEGSEFKHLKNLEVLKRLEKQVPESAKGAIALAQENTLKFFNRDIVALPEEARAERFEQYSRFSYGDETRQLSFLDDLKLLEDVPPEILKKIEEVKEFAIAKFEDKMRNFENPDVLENYMKNLSGESFDDIVLTEQLASRVVFEDNPEIKQRMNEIRDRSVQEFTNRFTDPDSQAQIAKFQELESTLEKRPGDPKVIKMMQELEAQVRSDPAKAAFLSQINQLEDKMRFDFEEKFRQEGDQYFDRIGTLDPRDFEVYQQFSGENFLPEDLAEKFLDRGVDQYRDYVKDIDDPNSFDRFSTKFTGISQLVIDDIKNRDSEFGDAIQFKRQAMEKLRFEQERQMEIERSAVDYQEKELSYQLDRARRQADEEFWQKVNSIPYENFDERKALFEEKRQVDLSRLDKAHKARLEIFNKRLELDPWCDSSCKQIQKQFIDQEFRHQKERIQDDYISSQKRIEFDLARAKQDNPLFGVCDTPESCDSYCQANPNVYACKPFFNEPVFQDDFNNGRTDEPKDYDCGPGKYFDFEHNECRTDPYYKAPENFTKCKSGTHWNENRGFCEADFAQTIIKPIVNKPDCGPDSYFDFKENRCISYRIEPKCPADSYTGPSGECVKRDFQCPDITTAFPAPCSAGQNRDIITDSNGCRVFSECRGDGLPIACPVFDYLPCSDGEYREEYRNSNGCLVPGECIPDGNVTCTAYFEGYEYNGATKRCELRGTSGCSNPYKYSSLSECQEGNVTGTIPTSSNWVDHIWYFNDGSTHSSILNRTDTEYKNYIAKIEAQCKTISQNKFAWKPGAGNDSSSNWQNFGIPDCSGTANQNYWCGNNTCDPGEDTYNCSADCGNSGASTYIGDENSCPGFAYSVWDQNGARYCRLNGTEACDYNYPSYLTNDGSYTQANCPTYDNQPTYPVYGDCYNNKSSDSCYAQPGCNWFTNPDGYQYCEGDNFVPPPAYPSTYVGDSECSDILDILPGCHLMSESPNVRFNSQMDQYIQVGTRTIQYCSGESIPGCTSYYSSDGSTDSSTYCPPPSYWDSSTNGCAPTTDTSSTPSCDGAGGFECPSGYEYDVNGCVSGCLPDYTEEPPPAPTCMTPSDYGTCDYGYEYDTSGCVIGCSTAPPPPPPAEEPPPEEPPPPAAIVWEALKALFGF